MEERGRDVPHVRHDRIGVLGEIDDVADRQMDHQVEDLLIDMVQGEEGDGLVVPGPPAHGVRLLPDPEIPLVGEHRPFGGARGSRGVDDPGDILAAPLGHEVHRRGRDPPRRSFRPRASRSSKLITIGSWKCLSPSMSQTIIFRSAGVFSRKASALSSCSSSSQI